MSKREINAFRASMGLPKIIAGKIPCLCCGIGFNSEDVVKNRICRQCHKDESRHGYDDTVYSAGKLKPFRNFSIDMVSSPKES